MPQPIQIRRADVVRDARTLAHLTGRSITDVVGDALKAQLSSQAGKAKSRLARKRAAVEKALAEIRELPVVGPRLTDKDLYRRNGLPK